MSSFLVASPPRRQTPSSPRGVTEQNGPRTTATTARRSEAQDGRGSFSRLGWAPQVRGRGWVQSRSVDANQRLLSLEPSGHGLGTPYMKLSRAEQMDPWTPAAPIKQDGYSWTGENCYALLVLAWFRLCLSSCAARTWIHSSYAQPSSRH